MKKLLFILFLFVCSSIVSFAQKVTIVIDTNNIVYKSRDTTTSFAGKATALKKDLEQKLNLDAIKENHPKVGTYVVVVRFISDNSGNVSDVIPETSNGYGMEAEVLKVIRKQQGLTWRPVPQNQKSLPKEYCRAGITFIVSKNNYYST